jgi:hypothetical protein
MLQIDKPSFFGRPILLWAPRRRAYNSSVCKLCDYEGGERPESHMPAGVPVIGVCECEALPGPQMQRTVGYE